MSLATRALTPWPLAPIAFYVNVLPILSCFTGSVIYHTLMAKHVYYRRWLLVDVRMHYSKTAKRLDYAMSLFAACFIADKATDVCQPPGELEADTAGHSGEMPGKAVKYMSCYQALRPRTACKQGCLKPSSLLGSSPKLT